MTVDDIAPLLAINLAVTLGCMVVLWLLSIRRGDPSFIDAWWPMGFVVVAWVTFLVTDGDAAPARRARGASRRCGVCASAATCSGAGGATVPTVAT